MGLPELSFAYQAAARTVANRSKRGIVALILRDAQPAAGVYTVVYEADIPTELGAENRAYVKRALTGYVNVPSKVLLSVIGADAEVTEGVAQLTGLDYDYLCGPADLSAEDAKTLGDKVIALRAGNYVGKLVAPGLAADNEGIINFTGAEIVAGGVTYSTAAWCSRIAGMLAGSPLEGSATGAALPEVTSVKQLTDEALDQAIDVGQLVLYHDGRKVRLGTAVNSKVTLGEGESAILKKIKAIEAIDLIHYFSVTTAEDEYRGQCANTYDNKMVLVAALREFLTGLEDEDVLEEDSSGAEIDLEATRAWLKNHEVDVTSMSDEEILRKSTGDNVFISLYGYILDAMENFRISLTVKNS